MKLPHKKWLQSESQFQLYHLKVSGFEKNLKNLRKRNKDLIESYAKLALPFSVQSQVVCKKNLGWKDSTAQIVYVDLRTSMEDYVVLNDVDDFEIV